MARPFDDHLLPCAGQGHVEQPPRLLFHGGLEVFEEGRGRLLGRKAGDDLDPGLPEDIRQIIEVVVGDRDVGKARLDLPVHAADRDDRPFESLGAVPGRDRHRVLVHDPRIRLRVVFLHPGFEP